MTIEMNGINSNIKLFADAGGSVRMCKNCMGSLLCDRKRREQKDQVWSPNREEEARREED
jgi:hypothetical protein